jgi:predicted nucleic acid-binding protein
MSFLWDSNILRHYLDDHTRLLQNLKKVPRQNVLLPVVVAAEQLRGRSDAVLKAEPAQLARTQELFRQTQILLSRFQILYFDEKSLAVAANLKEQVKTRKRYADVLIAAQALAGHHVLVTRNTEDFRDILSFGQLQNWIDDEIR